MALDDKSTLIPGVARFYTATVGTAAPTKAALKNKETALTSWTEVGHTSIESVFSLKAEGGDTTVKGTLQNKALRTVTSPIVRTIEIALEQFDAPTLKRYLGANAREKDGLTYAQSIPTAEQCALLILAEDGANTFVVHAEKAEISANGDLDLDSPEDLASIPLKFTLLEGATGVVGMGLHKGD